MPVNGNIEPLVQSSTTSLPNFMHCTTHIQPTPVMGFAAQGTGTYFDGSMKRLLHQASAKVDVVATQ